MQREMDVRFLVFMALEERASFFTSAMTSCSQSNLWLVSFADDESPHLILVISDSVCSSVFLEPVPGI